MIRVTAADFKKLVAFLIREGQEGAYLTFSEEQTRLMISTVDRANKYMVIELSDKDYPFMPTVTKKETF